MAHRIVGTAGHIDHGKTALVRALTGVETDRLREERERGITIELGFAPLDLGDGRRLGVVDVPGHERFVRHMLAGAGGIDVVLLAVAADESIKPQTREHLDICRLLGVQAGVVALTKADLAEPDILALVRAEVADLVAGTFLEGAEVVPCSAADGSGIEEVRSALGRCVDSLAAAERADFPRLPVDRAFSMKGFGGVVTGTLLSGAIAPEDELILWPAGESLRVRRVEVHGREAARAESGQRTAVNLVGGRRPPRRGDLLAGPGRMEAGSLLDVTLEILASAPRQGLRDQSRVRLHLGTAELEARVRLLGEERALPPGARGSAQLRLSRPLAAAPGDRFILRRASPALTLGGGRVVDPSPRKHRRGDPALSGRVLEMGRSPAARRLELILEEAGAAGLDRREMVIRTGRSPQEVAALAAPLVQAGAVADPSGGLLHATAAAALSDRVLAVLEAFHAREPLAPGMSLQELRRRAAPRTPGTLVDALLERMAAAGRLRLDGSRVAAAHHRVALDAAEESRLESVLAEIRAGGFDPPDPHDLLAAAGAPPGRARDLVRLLTERGDLQRVSDTLYLHRERLAELRSRLQERRLEDPLFDVAWFKAVTGTSRRAAIPLLEYLDASRVTTRRGDQRYIREPEGGE